MTGARKVERIPSEFHDFRSEPKVNVILVPTGHYFYGTARIMLFEKNAFAESAAIKVNERR